MTSASGEDALDSMKVDENGHGYFESGRVWILSTEGKHLGTIAVRNFCAEIRPSRLFKIAVRLFFFHFMDSAMWRSQRTPLQSSL